MTTSKTTTNAIARTICPVAAGGGQLGQRARSMPAPYKLLRIVYPINQINQLDTQFIDYFFVRTFEQYSDKTIKHTITILEFVLIH